MGGGMRSATTTASWKHPLYASKGGEVQAKVCWSKSYAEACCRCRICAVAKAPIVARMCFECSRALGMTAFRTTCGTHCASISIWRHCILYRTRTGEHSNCLRASMRKHLLWGCHSCELGSKRLPFPCKKFGASLSKASTWASLKWSGSGEIIKTTTM